MAILINSIYESEVLDKILVRATTGNELVSGGHIHVEPDVQKKFAIPRMKAGKMLQKRKEMPTGGDSKGNFNIDEKYLEPQDFMAFTTFNPRAFEKFWKKHQPKGNLVFRELPPDVQNQMLEEMAKVIDFELGYHYINGKYSAAEGDFFNGILTRIVADNDVFAISNAEEITGNNILSILKQVKGSVPKAIKRNPNLKIFMSDADFDTYDDVLTNKPYKGQDYTNINPERYKGVRIVPLADWPKDVIVAAVTSQNIDSNFWAGVDYVDDAEVIQIDKLTAPGELYFFKMLMKADTNIVFGEDIVLYDGRTEATTGRTTQLEEIAVSAGNLQPQFDPKVRQYTVSVENTVTSTTIGVVEKVDGQVIKLGGTTLTSGTVSAAQTLEVGDNIFTISVLSADKTDADVYLVTVKRAEA